MNRSPIKDYQVSQRKKEQNWFDKTTKSAIALITTFGLTYSYFKMKGPASKLLRNQEGERFKEYFLKSLSKYDDRPIDKIIEDIATKRLQLAQDISKEFYAPIDYEDQIVTTQSLIDDIEKHEATIFSKIKNIILKKLEQKNNVRSLVRHIVKENQSIVMNKIENISQFSEDSLARIRQQTIVEFLCTGAGMGKENFAQAQQDLLFYTAVDGNYMNGEHINNLEQRQIIERTTKIHEKFLREEPEYAALYLKRVARLAKRAKLFTKDDLSENMDWKNYRRWIYGNIASSVDTTNITVTPEITEIYSRQNPIDWSQGRSLTSGGKRPWKGSTHFVNYIGSIEYAPYIKRLIDKLDAATKEDTGLVDFRLYVESYNYLSNERRKLIIEMFHETKPSIKIEVPLETNGYLPSNSPSSLRKIGHFYKIKSVYGLNQESDSLIRSGQMILEDIINVFETSAMKGGIDSFKYEPEIFKKRIHSRINRRLEEHAIETGADRDIIQMGSIWDPELRKLVNPGQHSSKRLRTGYENFVLNIHNMKKIAKSDKKSAVIAIDLESLSNSRTGPEFTVNDFGTQFVKAGIAIMDLSDNSVIDGVDISSTHGLKYFRRVGMNKRLKNWLRTNVIPNGTDIPDELLEQAYEKYLKSIGAVDFKDNKQFLTAVKEQIEKYRSELIAKGYNVYIVTKNGSLFDLRALEYHVNDPTWISWVKKNHIDIQATASVIKRGYSLPTALNAERMLMSLLSDLGEGEIASQIVRGHTMNLQERRELVKKILNAFKKKRPNSVGRLSALLNLSNSLIKKFEKRGWLEALHASPLLDALGTLGLFSCQFESMKADPMYINLAGTIEKYLKSDPGIDTARNIFGVIQKMLKRTYPGFDVVSASSMSHGSLHKQVVSVIDLFHLLPFPDNDPTRQNNQLRGQQWYMKPNLRWFERHRDPKLSADVQKRLIYGDWITTDFIHDIRQQTLPRATDALNQYTKSVMMKVCYALDFTGGGQEAGINLVTENALNKFSLAKLEYIDISDGPNTTDPVLNERLRAIEKETIAILGGPEKAAKATAEEWEAAGRKASNGTVITLSEEILGASKYNEIKSSKKGLKGRIITIIKEPAEGGLTRTKVAIELFMSGVKAGRLAAQTRPYGSKAVLSVVKPFTYGVPKGYDGVFSLKALSKGFVGDMKGIIFNKILVELFTDYHRSDTNSLRKAQIKKAIDYLAQKAHAQYDLDKIHFRFIRSDIGSADEIIKYLGNVDIQMHDLFEAARMGGLVWTPKEVEEIKANKGKWNAVAYLIDSIDKHLLDMRKKIESGNGTLEGMDKMTSQRTYANLKAFRDILLPDEKHPKLIDILDISGYGTSPKYKAFLTSYIDSLNMYGITNVHKFETSQRNEYMLVSKADPKILGVAHAEWMNRFVVHKSSRVHRSALKTFQAFRNVLLGEQMLTNPLNLEQLNVLLDRDQSLRLRSTTEKAKMPTKMTPTEIAEVTKNLENLIEMAEEANDTEQAKFLKKTYDEFISLLSTNSKSMFSALRKSPRFFTYNEVAKWQEEARKHNGIIPLLITDPAGNNVYKIDIKAQIKGLVGIVAGDHTMDASDFDRIYKNIADVLDTAQKKAKKPLPYKFDKETGVIEFTNGAIFFPFDRDVENNFNKLSVNTFLGTKATSIKMELAEAVARLQEAAEKKDWIEWEEKTKLVDRKYIEMLMLSFGADKNSKLWNAIQFNPPSVWKKHKGIEFVKLQAQELLDALSSGGGPSELMNIKGFDVRTVLGNIIRADLNTILITDSVLSEARVRRSFTTPKGVVFDGSTIRYISYLEKALPKYAKEVKTGQRYLPGGIMIRFPQTQSGKYAQLNSKYLVIPSILKGYLGLDDNSFYAHTLWSSLQGNDSDGDYDALHFVEFNTMEEHNRLMRESRESLKILAQEPAILNVVKRKKFTYDDNGNIVKTHIHEGNWVVHWFEGGKALISSLDIDANGNLITTMKTVDKSTLDITDFPEAIIKMASSMAVNAPDYADASTMMQKHLTKSAIPALTKQLIPQATNLLKKRAAQLYVGAQVGLLPGGRGAFLSHLGTISSGLTGIIGQLPISLTKHSDRAQLTETINALRFLSNVDKYYSYKDDFIDFAYRLSKQETLIDPLKKTKEDFYRELSHEIDLFRAFDVLDRMNPEIRSLDVASLNAMSGRGNATWWDFMKIKDTSIDDILDFDSKKMVEVLGSLKLNLDFSDNTARFIRKSARFGAVGAAIFLGLSFFKPISPSTSNSPFGAYIGLDEPKVDVNLISANLELPRHIPLDIVNASFSNEAYIKLNETDNPRKDKAIIVNSTIKRNSVLQPYDFYQVPLRSNRNYTTYGTYVPYMGTVDLQRRAKI